MNSIAYSQHPDDPRTLLVKKPDDIPALMARRDVHTVIWERNLRYSYRTIFNQKSWENLNAFVGMSDGRHCTAYLNESDNSVTTHYSGPSYGECTQKMKGMMPALLWDDVTVMSQLVIALSKKKYAKIWPISDRPDSLINKFDNWHCHTGVTAHMTVNDATLELLNYQGLHLTKPTGLREIFPSLFRREIKESLLFSESAIPPQAKIIRPKASDIVFFKNTLHRRSQQIATEGRFALAIYSN